MKRASLSSFVVGVTLWFGPSLVACGGQSAAPSADGGSSASPSGDADTTPTEIGPNTTAADSKACHTDDDCSNLTSQYGPVDCFGPTAGCGGRVACSVDSDCSAQGEVCSKIQNGLSSCRLPCTSDDACAPTDACDPGGHCVARTCDNCPSFLACSNGACLAQACAADSDCPGGYCVEGSCADRLGYCRVLCE